MSEETKLTRALGRAVVRRMVVSTVMAVAPIVVLAWLCGSSMGAGLIHEDLVGPVFWLQLMCFPFAAVAFGVGLGLILRRLNLAPFREVLGPLGPESRYLLSGVKWTLSRPGSRAEVRVARRSFVIEVQGPAEADLRGGRDNRLARLAMSDAWATETLDGGVIVASKDGEALRRHLAREGTAEAWARLLVDDRQSLRAVSLTPGKSATLSFRHVPSHVLSEAQVREWVADLDTLLGNP